MAVYRIVADESWTHNTDPLRRYWCILSGVLLEETEYNSFFNELNDIKKKSSCEIKWSNLTYNSQAIFTEFINAFFEGFNKFQSLKLRQLHNVRNHLFSEQLMPQLPNVEINKMFGVDGQFKIYYQFLKHHFGIEHLPVGSELLILLDEHSSEKHTSALNDFVTKTVANLPNISRCNIVYVRSSRNALINAVDLVGGAFGFKANKMESTRENGKRGMSDRQRMRQVFADHVRTKLELLSKAERPNLQSFVWTESNGKIDCPKFKLTQNLRIWKFIPKHHHYDKGWDNDHLEKKLYYKSPEVSYHTVDGGINKTPFNPPLTFTWV